MYHAIQLRLINLVYPRLMKSCKQMYCFGPFYLVNPQNISIGKNVYINHGVYLNGKNPITIGDYVTLSAGASIVPVGKDLNKFSKGEYGHKNEEGILIGNHVWVGCNASIIGSVKITGKYVVIGAGAVVNKDITEDYTVWAGVPAKIVKKINSNTIDDLL